MMKLPVDKLTPVVVISATAAAGRILFSFIPQVQPVTALVILSGLSLGPFCGGATGVLSAFVSNIVLGQGPWTLFQMLAWGLIGSVAGFMGKHKISSSLPVVCVYAFLSGLLFSLITDFSSLLYHIGGISPEAFGGLLLAGLLFNISHAVSNVFFVFVLYHKFLQKLTRIRDKYGFLC